MKMLIAAGLFALSVAAVAVQPQARAEDEKKGAASLEGGYTIVSGEHGGKAIPEEHIKGSIVKITADLIVGTDKDKKEFFSSSYTLDTSKKPWAITMKSKEPKEATALGLVKKEGDTVTIVYATPGGDTPTDFKTKEKQNLFVLKNMNKAPGKP